MEWQWQGKTEALGANPVPVPVYPPKTSHGLVRHRNRGSAMRGRRLTASTMDSTAYHLLFFLRPLFFLLIFFFFFFILYFYIERFFHTDSPPHYNTALLPNRPQQAHHCLLQFRLPSGLRIFGVLQEWDRHWKRQQSLLSRRNQEKCKWRFAQQDWRRWRQDWRHHAWYQPRAGCRLHRGYCRRWNGHKADTVWTSRPGPYQTGFIRLCPNTVRSRFYSRVQSNGEHHQQVLWKLACVLHVLSCWQRC